MDLLEIRFGHFFGAAAASAARRSAADSGFGVIWRGLHMRSQSGTQSSVTVGFFWVRRKDFGVGLCAAIETRSAR